MGAFKSVCSCTPSLQAKLNQTQRELDLLRFRAATKCGEDEAEFYLRDSAWSLQARPSPPVCQRQLIITW